jgi:membrane protease YdiL (CAAX protease family)
LLEKPEAVPVNLPVSALMFVIPVTAASILVYRRDGSAGVKALFARAGDFRRIPNGLWWAVSFLLMPAIYTLAYAAMRLAGRPLPEPQFSLLAIPAFFVLYFIGAVGEELGWTGYATDPLQVRYGALATGVIIGAVWAVWHIIPYLQANNSPGWIFWQCLGTIGTRVLMVWVYNSASRSVFAAVLVHTMLNLSWSMFPNFGSHYDPLFTGAITLLLAAVVVWVWRPKTPAR